MIDWIIDNWQEVGVIAALVILAGERVARLTPTETDNKVLMKVRKIAQILGIDVPNNPGSFKSAPWIGVAALAMVLALSACASRVAETPAQRVFALQSEYNAALEIALAYESLPRCTFDEQAACSEVAVVETIRDADTFAFTAIEAAQNAVRAPDVKAATVRLSIEAARDALDLLQTILTKEIEQ